MSIFYFIAELSSFEELHTYIDGVLWLVDAVKFHQVFLIKVSHDFDLIDQRLLTFLFTESSFFWKGFNGIFLAIFMPDNQINWGKAAFANFFDGLKEFMEASLI